MKVAEVKLETCRRSGGWLRRRVRPESSFLKRPLRFASKTSRGARSSIGSQKESGLLNAVKVEADGNGHTSNRGDGQQFNYRCRRSTERIDGPELCPRTQRQDVHSPAGRREAGYRLFRPDRGRQLIPRRAEQELVQVRLSIPAGLNVEETVPQLRGMLSSFGNLKEDGKKISSCGTRPAASGGSRPTSMR